jgi:tRNA (pseudouridine54-N1)-methyltransferase
VRLRRFVLLCRAASASEDFLLDDLPGTSGRLDVALRCIRASLLVSHGLRRDVTTYVVLGGGPRAPRVLRVSGADARFLRPDERSLAVLARKVLASRADEGTDGFVEVRPGIALARGGLEDVLRDLGGAAPFVLERAGVDVRDSVDLGASDAAFFLGDHLGLAGPERDRLTSMGARPLSLGPVEVHAEDAIALVLNELDRRSAGG